jgi:hypothetical protein
VHFHRHGTSVLMSYDFALRVPRHPGRADAGVALPAGVAIGAVSDADSRATNLAGTGRSASA